MDEDQFRSYLKKNKKSKSAIESIVEIVREYEGYLLGEGIELSAAQTEDLEGFVLWIENALNYETPPSYHEPLLDPATHLCLRYHYSQLRL
jgi:hypothetical protein